MTSSRPTTGWALVIDYSAFTTRFFVFHTTDGAAHWYKQYAGKARGDRPYLHFFDALHGFAYAGFSYRTVDGGAHWRVMNVPGSQPYRELRQPDRRMGADLQIRLPVHVSDRRRWRDLEPARGLTARSRVGRACAQARNLNVRQPVRGVVGGRGDEVAGHGLRHSRLRCHVALATDPVPTMRRATATTLRSGVCVETR